MACGTLHLKRHLEFDPLQSPNHLSKRPRCSFSPNVLQGSMAVSGSSSTDSLASHPSPGLLSKNSNAPPAALPRSSRPRHFGECSSGMNEEWVINNLKGEIRRLKRRRKLFIRPERRRSPSVSPSSSDNEVSRLSDDHSESSPPPRHILKMDNFGQSLLSSIGSAAVSVVASSSSSAGPSDDRASRPNAPSDCSNSASSASSLNVCGGDASSGKEQTSQPRSSSGRDMNGVGGPSTSSRAGAASLPDPNVPVFSINQVAAIANRMLREHEERLRHEYQQVLNSRLAEQYDAFLRYSQEQAKLRSAAMTTVPSYVS